jgi:hypothetical protein
VPFRETACEFTAIDSSRAKETSRTKRRQGMKVRTVVTGFDAKGRSVFVQDAKIDGTPIPGLRELAFL